MKILQVLGHNFKWNIDSFEEQEIGDGFLITAFTFGNKFSSNKKIIPLIDKCMIDLQFYGKKARISAGKLVEFSFHPTHNNSQDPTNTYISNCIVEAINFQINNGFTKIIIPCYYEDEDIKDVIAIVKVINNYISKNKIKGLEYYMTIPLAHDIIKNKDKVDEILVPVTDKDIAFDGYFIACENKPEQGHKLTVDVRLIQQLSRVFKTLKYQGFKTIYAYANWDAIIYLAQTDIDYITIGTYENLRNFSVRRFTEDISGGASDGYYFSEKILNMIRAKDILNIQSNNMISDIRNNKNIFSDVILKSGYMWNIHKPDVNKNYLLSISNLLDSISKIQNIRERTIYVLYLIQGAINTYQNLDDNYVAFAGSESKNYHLEVWKQYLLKSIGLKPSEFDKMYNLI